MKIKERLVLLKAGYSRKEIDDMIKAEDAAEAETAETSEEKPAENSNSAETVDYEKQIADLKDQLKQMQNANIAASSKEAPKAKTSADVWQEFFGVKEN